MIEKYLAPVSEQRRVKSIPDQITKVAVELSEVREAYSKYEMMKCWNKTPEELERLKRDVAMNEIRGYYGEGEK